MGRIKFWLPGWKKTEIETNQLRHKGEVIGKIVEISETPYGLEVTAELNKEGELYEELLGSLGPVSLAEDYIERDIAMTMALYPSYKIDNNYDIEEDEEDMEKWYDKPLSPARGIMFGMLFGTLFWAVVFIVIWWMGRGW